jgi:hypothetical protein
VSRARSCAVLAAGLGFGVALRLYVAAAAEGKSFSDNAVVALMAMHALRGKLYAFYWGQSYMGSLEAVVVAPFFALFGVGDLALSAGLLPWYLAYAASSRARSRSSSARSHLRTFSSSRSRRAAAIPPRSRSERSFSGCRFASRTIR